MHLSYTRWFPMRALSRWIEEVTQPSHPHYHPVQAALFGSISYIGTACLLSIPPENAMVVTIIAYTINLAVAPLISKWLQRHMDVSLVPLIGQVIHLSIAYGIANVICRLGGCSIPLKAVAAQILIHISAIALTRLGLLNFRHNIAIEKG